MAAAKEYVIFMVTLLFYSAFPGQCDKEKKGRARLCPEPFFTSEAGKFGRLKNLFVTTKKDPLLQETTQTSEELKDRVKGISTDSTTNELEFTLKGWIAWEDSFYMFVNISLNWDEAVKACKSYHEDAHLVFIESAEENEFIHDAVKVMEFQRWWIGMHDKNIEGLWEWYDTPSNYSNWYPIQPDDSGNGEDCCEIFGTTGQWNDLLCAVELHFICEI